MRQDKDAFERNPEVKRFNWVLKQLGSGDDLTQCRIRYGWEGNLIADYWTYTQPTRQVSPCGLDICQKTFGFQTALEILISETY